MQNSKVCILTSVHPPLDGRIFYREARGLAKAGYDITVLSLSGEGEKIVDGIKVFGMPRPKNRVHRILGGLRLLRKALQLRSDAYHFHDPELVISGVLLKILTRRPVIYDVHEYNLDMIMDKPWIIPSLRPTVRALINLYEKFLCPNLSGIIVVDDLLYQRYRTLNRNVVKLPNFPVLETFDLSATEQIETETHFETSNTMIYEGVISATRGAEILISAVEELRTKIPDICLLMLCRVNDAKYKKEFDELVLRKHLEDNIRFIDFVPYSDVPRYIAIAKLGLVPLQPLPRYVKAIPVKLFEYMACGIPVVASNFPKIAEIVESANCGILVDPTNPKEIAKTILYLLQHPEDAKRMGENGRKAVEEKYSWEAVEPQLLDFYTQLLQ